MRKLALLEVAAGRMRRCSRIFGGQAAVKGAGLALWGVLAAAWGLALGGVCVADERPVSGQAAMKLLRVRIAEEAKRTAASPPGNADRVVREGVEWYAGRLLFESEGGAGPELRPECALSLLTLAWREPGQRFHRADRTRSALAHAMKRAAPAAGSADAGRGSGLAERRAAQVLVEALFAAGEEVDGASAAAVTRALDRLSERTQGRGPAERSWRARARLALAVWRRDVSGAMQARDDVLAALAEADAAALSGAPEGLVERTLCAADALCVRAWTQGTELAAPDCAATALRDVEGFFAWLWRGRTVDPLLAPDRGDAEVLEAAALEGALRGGVRPDSLFALGLEAWGERGEEWPGLTALTLARLCPLPAAEGWPGEWRGGLRTLANAEGGAAIAKTQRRTVSMTTHSAPDDGVCVRAGEHGLFNVYDGARAALLRRTEARNVCPGALVLSSGEAPAG
ncbi:MAG TPA: hypothetical protein P5137_16620, partial [Candidatus Brocadiia bacterium]|nr:hypothetical protein [Candidatus Brocadiia bacterium]